jgi:hypothetical protein
MNLAGKKKMLIAFSSLHVIKLTKLLTHSYSTECKLKRSWPIQVAMMAYEGCKNSICMYIGSTLYYENIK